MTIDLEFKIEKCILLVTAKGRDDNLKQVQEYGVAVMAAAKENNCNKIICDETELKYSLSTFNTFKLAESLSNVIPYAVKVAIVCNPNQFTDARFWETVAVNRGAHVRVFKDMDSAEKWIKLNG